MTYITTAISVKIITKLLFFASHSALITVRIFFKSSVVWMILTILLLKPNRSPLCGTTHNACIRAFDSVKVQLSCCTQGQGNYWWHCHKIWGWLWQPWSDHLNMTVSCNGSFVSDNDACHDSVHSMSPYLISNCPGLDLQGSFNSALKVTLSTKWILTSVTNIQKTA